jgi:cysteine-rich CPXCG protein
MVWGGVRMITGFQCAGCGEWNETRVDSSAGTKQSYVEDCQVCCKPNVLRVTWDPGGAEFVIESELE